MRAIIHHTDRNALTCNGWLASDHGATREYRGNIVARIGADGSFKVTVGRDIRATGKEANVIYAAMEANERAWSQPEYATAEA